MIRKPLSIQPIPYQGSKRLLAPYICSLFPKKVETLYEPFAGSAAVTLFAATYNLAERFVIGDFYGPLVELWKLIIENPSELSERYTEVWNAQFDVGTFHFKEVRSQYNENSDPVLLLYLIARCVKNAVRFNKNGQFTQSADKRRTGMKPDRLTRIAHTVSRLLRGRTTVFHGDFLGCVEGSSSNDLIYMDPPYHGTTYGADKRYASGLERERLIEGLHYLDTKSIPYILSYDGQVGSKVYGEPLPFTVKADRLALHAGRSAQATISGKCEETIESLYVSHTLHTQGIDTYRTRIDQGNLFT